MFGDYLLNNGFTKVYTAASGTEAISLLAGHPNEIYLVLLDMKMPGMDGMAVVKHIANVHNINVGIIIITGYASQDDAIEFYKSSTDTVIALDYVSKPVELGKLLKEIECALDSIHKKRIGHLSMSADSLHSRFDKIEEKLSAIDALPEIRQTLLDLSKKHRGLIAELGMDLIRALLIALSFIALIYFGVGNFLHAVIKGS